MQIESVAPLMQMLLEVEQARMRPILEREAALRRDLAQLSDHEKTNRTLPQTQRDVMRPIGADVRWDAWLGRTRAELNRQLALCLAQKEHYLAVLRKAYGRKIAADAVVSELARLQAKSAEQRRQSSIDQLAMLHRFNASKSLF